VCIAGLVVSGGVGRGSAAESFGGVAILILVVTPVFVGMPFFDGLETRRKIHGARRLAVRLQSGRRTRAEAEGDPFIGPPSVDLFAVGSAALGLFVGRSGFVAFGVALVVVPIVSVAVALGERRRVRLGLPETYSGAKVITLPFGLGALAAAFLSQLWGATKTVFPALVFVWAFLFCYTGYVALAEERVSNTGIGTFIRRDERPVIYWLLMLLLFGLALLLMILLIVFRPA
jgi:hypothetical protein